MELGKKRKTKNDEKKCSFEMKGTDWIVTVG